MMSFNNNFYFGMIILVILFFPSLLSQEKQ